MLSKFRIISVVLNRFSFIWKTKVVTGRVTKAVVLFSNDCMELAWSSYSEGVFKH